jgi:hypothetical protein
MNEFTTLHSSVITSECVFSKYNLFDPQIGVVSSWPDTAICVRNVDVLCVCNSHLFSGLAPFFIDPRA